MSFIKNPVDDLDDIEIVNLVDRVPELQEEISELTGVQVDLQLTESQIHRMTKSSVLSSQKRKQSLDGNTKKESYISILSLLKEHTCNYDLDSPSYKNFAQKLDQGIEQFDKSVFGSIAGEEDSTFDGVVDDGVSPVLSPASSGPRSPMSPVHDDGGSFSSMYEDLQEEIATLRQRSVGGRSNSSSKYKDIFQSRSPKIPLKVSNRGNEKSTPIVTKEPVMSEEGFEQEIRDDVEKSEQEIRDELVEVYGNIEKSEKEIRDKLEFFRNIEKSGEQNVCEVDENIAELPVADRETAVSAKDRRPPSEVMILRSSSSSSEYSGILRTFSSMTEDGARYRIDKGFQDMNIGPSKSCVPPIFQKRLGMLGRLKSMKSASTHMTSKMTAESYPTMRLKSCSGSVADQESVCYIYEYGSDKNAYIAYFRRAEEARTHVRLYEHPTPPVFSTLASEVVIKVEASTVSATDCAIRRGDYWGEGSRNALNLPIVPGVTFAGRIIQGDKMRRSGLNTGDRVISLVRVGANSRHLCISRDRLVKVPPEISDPASACCLPELYLAAFQALHHGQKNSARYRKTALAGKSILVLGGDTVHGRAAIELAVAAGASIVYGAGQEDQFGKIREVGGFPVHRDPRQWYALAEGKLDLVIGSNGGDYARSELKYEHIRMLNHNGKLVLLTGPDQDEKSCIDLDKLDNAVHPTKRQMLHLSVFDNWETDPRQGKRDLTHLLKLLEDGFIRPKILERVPLSKVAKAQDMMENKTVRGFVVCEPWIKSAKRGAMQSGTDFYSESLNQSKSFEKQPTGSGSVQSKKQGSTNGPGNPLANAGPIKGPQQEGTVFSGTDFYSENSIQSGDGGSKLPPTPGGLNATKTMGVAGSKFVPRTPGGLNCKSL